MKYLFYLAKQYSLPVIDPLVRFLDLYRPQSQYRFLISKGVEGCIPKNWDKRKILKGIRLAIQFAPDAVICPGNYVDHRIPGLKVQVFHGVGVEKASHYRIRGFFDLYLTSGPFVTEKFLRLGEKYRYFSVAETGWPKFDHIINYTKNYDLPKLSRSRQKVILYAPTFSRRMESASVLLEKIPELIQPGEIWLIKFHELMNLQLVESLKQELNNQILILDRGDITPYLHLADIMISDTSSVIYEFSCLDKPVITYRTLGNKEKGLDIQEASELRPTLNKVIEDPNYKLKERRYALSRVNPWLDGNNSRRVIEAIENLNPSKLAGKKPLNLVRKGKILYNYYFKKGHFN
ncbi:MAG: CDP-glycerol glycerophosphotransferase [Saprospirales bacterium]|nr:MAG: CDP-glycerol glycerophosphotransferase [Saprospirales bacterium]